MKKWRKTEMTERTGETGELTVNEIRDDNLSVKNKMIEQQNHCRQKIKELTDEIKFIDSMNDKLKQDLDQTPVNHYKKKSQLQSIYLRNIEGKSILQSTLSDYEKLLSFYLKEERNLNNDKVKNYKNTPRRERILDNVNIVQCLRKSMNCLETKCTREIRRDS